MKEKLLRYEELKRFEKSVEEEIKTLGAEILSEFQAQGAKESPPLIHGKIVVSGRKAWSYSDAVDRGEIELKRLKATEQANGTAEYTETTFLKYEANK